VTAPWAKHDEDRVAGRKRNIWHAKKQPAQFPVAGHCHRAGVRLEVARDRDEERRAEICDVGPAFEAERTREVQLPIADVGHEHEPQAADQCRERPGIDLRRVAQGGRGDAEQEHEVADRVSKGERGGQGVRVQGRENRSKQRVPDDDATADDHDHRVDREPESVAPGGRCALEHEEGDDDDRVVVDVGEVGQRRRGRAAAKVQPGKCPVAHGIDEHRDGQHRPTKANPTDVDVKRRTENDHYGQQIQGGLGDIGNGTLRARTSEAGHEPEDGEAPAAGSESQKDPIERDAAGSHLRMG